MDGAPAPAESESTVEGLGGGDRERHGHTRVDPDPDRARRRAHYASLQYASASPMSSNSSSTATSPLGTQTRSSFSGNGAKATDTNALRSLRYSVLRGETEAVEAALSGGALRVDDVLDPKSKQLALHLAASKGRDLIVQLLLQHNADPAAVDGAGKTAGDIATEKGFPVIASNLEAYVRRQQSAQEIQEKIRKKDGAPLPSVAAVPPAINWRKSTSNNKNFMSLPMGATLAMYKDGDPFSTSLSNVNDARAASASASTAHEPPPPAAAGAAASRNADRDPVPVTQAGSGPGPAAASDLTALFRSLPVGSTHEDLTTK